MVSQWYASWLVRQKSDSHFGVVSVERVSECTGRQSAVRFVQQCTHGGRQRTILALLLSLALLPPIKVAILRRSFCDDPGYSRDDFLSIQKQVMTRREKVDFLSCCQRRERHCFKARMTW